MLLVLRKEGLFSELCASPDEWCDAQQCALGAIFTWAAMAYSCSGIVVGSYIDYMGPAYGILFAAVTSIMGFYLFAGSWGWAPPWVILSGYCLIGVGGMAYFQCAFKAQYAFPLRHSETDVIQGYQYQTLIIAGATTLGDASVLCWLLMELTNSVFEVPLSTMFAYYSMFTVAISSVLFTLWRYCETDICGDVVDSSEACDDASAVAMPYGSTSPLMPAAQGEKAEASHASEVSYVNLSERTVLQQLRSWEFVFLAAFASVHTTRSNLYLGLLGNFYGSAQFGFVSSDLVASYVNITSALVPLGCLCAPLVDFFIRTLGYGWTAQTIAIIGAAQSLIMLSPIMPLQLLAASLFVVYRANVFAFPPAFAGHAFGPRTVGRLTGIMFTLTAPVQFVLTPALGLTLTSFGDNFRPLSLVQLACLVPMVLFTSWLMRTSREEGLRLPHEQVEGGEDSDTRLARAARHALPVTPPISKRLQQQRGDRTHSVDTELVPMAPLTAQKAISF